MAQYNISEKEREFIIECEGTPLISVKKIDGAKDSFTEIETGVYRWTRITDAPTDEMRMEFDRRRSFTRSIMEKTE